jgi:hypothetical protein
MTYLAILVIFYVNMITCQIFKLVTWYPNVVHIIWNDMVQYTFNFHKD